MNEPDAEPVVVASRLKFPRRMFGLTLVVGVILLALNFFHEQLNELVQLNPGVPQLVTFLMIFVLGVAWVAWVLFRSGWSWGPRCLVAALIALPPAIGLVLYQPVFDGDLRFVRFESRFYSPNRQFSEVVDASGRSTISLESASADFPQFLGPNRNATLTGIELATDWKTVPPETVWTIPVGESWSGFSVVGDFAFTQEQREQYECITCYEVETGAQHWHYQVERRHEDISAVGRVGPRATPTVYDGLLYALGGTGVLECLDAASGKLVWSKDIPAEVGIEQIQRTNSRGLAYTQENSTLTWGRSASPLMFEDLVIVPAGRPAGGDAVTMIAFDRGTGEEKWRGGKRSISYGSPSLVELAGQTQVVLVAEKVAVGHDPVSGKELWSHAWPGNSDGDASCSQVTALGAGQLLLSKGYGVGGELVEVIQEKDGWVTRSIAKNARVLKTKFNNPVVYQNHAYSLSDGFLECTQLPELKRRWKKRGRFGNGQLLLVGDKLLVHSEHGTLYLIEANPEKYSALGSYPTIDGVCWNTLCLSGDRLLVRSELEAAMVRMPGSFQFTEDSLQIAE